MVKLRRTAAVTLLYCAAASTAFGQSDPTPLHCDKAAAWKTYDVGIGLIRPDAAYACFDSPEYLAEQRAKYKYETAQAGIDAMQEDIRHGIFKPFTEYRAPPAATLSTAEMMASLYYFLKPIAESKKWTELGHTDSELFYYMKTATKNRDAQTRTGWMFSAFARARKNTALGTLEWYRSEADQFAVRCSAGSLASLQQIKYGGTDGTGESSTSSLTPAQVQFNDPAPGTIGDLFVNAVCAK